MTIEERKYQTEIVNAIIRSVVTNNKVIGTSSVGSGKTVISKRLIDYLLQRKKTVAFIVNKIELVNQTVKTFGEKNVSIVKAGRESEFDKNKPVQIIMFQTWNARKDFLDLPNIDVAIIDEIHEICNGEVYKKFLEQYPQTKIIGLTATPIDGEGYALEGFDELIDLYRTRDLQKLGYLVADKWYSSPQNLELENVKTTAGEFNIKDLGMHMGAAKKIQNVLSNFLKFASDKKTIIFAVSIAHAEALTKQFQEEGINAEVIHSRLDNLKDERTQLLADFKSGKIQVLINVGILTTGFDEPSVECIILARPTKSLRLFIQMCGRGLRLFFNKTECLFIDCANNVWEHGIATDNFDFNLKRDLDNPVKKKKKYVRKCPACESANPYKVEFCISCGFEFKKQTTSIEILNEDLKMVNIGDIEMKERGLPTIEHIGELLIICKNRSKKTMHESSHKVKGYFNWAAKKYRSKFDSDLEFLKFAQKEIIELSRKRHSYKAIMFRFKEHFEPKVEQNNQVTQDDFYRCLDCGELLTKFNIMAGQKIYFCSKHGGFRESLLKNPTKYTVYKGSI